MVSHEVWLPSDEELQVKHEINLSTPAFKAAAVFMNLFCEDKCKEFMLCRKEEKDPRRCLTEGKDVTACGIKFLQKVKKNCRAEFDQYAHCIDVYDSRLFVTGCRKLQREFDRCVFEHLGMNRPPIIGYFARPHVHKTDRPKPERHVRDYQAEAKSIMDELPADYPRRDDYIKLSEDPLQDRLFKTQWHDYVDHKF